MYPPAWSLVAAALTFTIVARICVIIVFPNHSAPRRRDHTENCHIAVFLGSGGHSSEALALVSTLDFSRYTPRTYLVSKGDSLSATKAIALERLKAASEPSLPPEERIGEYQILTIPRARRVHQNLLTLPVTLLGDSSTVDVLVLNGPGTCFVLCLAAYINRFLGLPSPKLVYVETFARVRTLSLTGKLLRPIVDRFIVQWPDLLQDGGRGECRGWLV
ncbi:glycosyltransferase family 1 protein [Lactarius quietus]|nr:glycosyltransferase family 1 protein [Lactarius quietus]